MSPCDAATVQLGKIEWGTQGCKTSGVVRLEVCSKEAARQVRRNKALLRATLVQFLEEEPSDTSRMKARSTNGVCWGFSCRTPPHHVRVGCPEDIQEQVITRLNDAVAGSPIAIIGCLEKGWTKCVDFGAT